MKLGHVCILVKNLDESILWYREMFGLSLLNRIQSNGKEIAFLQIGDSKIELLEDTANKVAEGVIDHICIESADIFSLYDHLKEKGVGFHQEEMMKIGSNKHTIYLTGLNGEKIQLLQT